MSETSKIQWTDSTHNFWQGCTKVSAGCTNCYAEARDKRFTGGKHWGKGAPRVRSKSFNEPLKWNKIPWVCDACGFMSDMQGDCLKCGRDHGGYHRRRVFSLSLGDWLDPAVPIEWLAEMLQVIRLCPDLDWLLCTKRPELWKQRMNAVIDLDKHCVAELNQWLVPWVAGCRRPDNIMLLTSVEDQKAADERIPALLKIPARWRGLSCEPLLGPVDLNAALKPIKRMRIADFDGINWVIIGGESGDKARICCVEWIQSLKKQSQAAGVPVFVKQLGAKPMHCPPPLRGWVAMDIHDKKGGDIAEFPEDLQVREFYQ